MEASPGEQVSSRAGGRGAESEGEEVLAERHQMPERAGSVGQGQGHGHTFEFHLQRGRCDFHFRSSVLLCGRQVAAGQDRQNGDQFAGVPGHGRVSGLLLWRATAV